MTLFNATAIRVNPKTIRQMEAQYEDLRCDMDILKAEIRELEERCDGANSAVIELWYCVPEDVRAQLIEENDYIREMFWDERRRDE